MRPLAPHLLSSHTCRESPLGPGAEHTRAPAHRCPEAREAITSLFCWRLRGALHPGAAGSKSGEQRRGGPSNSSCLTLGSLLAGRESTELVEIIFLLPRDSKTAAKHRECRQEPGCQARLPLANLGARWAGREDASTPSQGAGRGE